MCYNPMNGVCVEVFRVVAWGGGGMLGGQVMWPLRPANCAENEYVIEVFDFLRPNFKHWSQIRRNSTNGSNFLKVCCFC
jgi:hypothetical protein